MPNSEDRKSQKYYFTLASAKIRVAVQFCERMGIN